MKNQFGILTILSLTLMLMFGTYSVTKRYYEPRNQHFEYYMYYDLFHVHKEKGFWIVSSEREPYYKICNTYTEAMQLVSDLSFSEDYDYSETIFQAENNN